MMTLKLISPEVPAQLRPAEYLTPQDIVWPVSDVERPSSRISSLHAYIDFAIATRDPEPIGHAASMAEIHAADGETEQASITPVQVYMDAFKARAEGSNNPLRQVSRPLYGASRVALREMILPNGEPLDAMCDHATLMVGLLTVDQSFPALTREANGANPAANHNLYPLQVIGGNHIKTPLVVAYSIHHKDTILPDSTINRIYIADIAADVMVSVPGPHELLVRSDARHTSKDPAIRAAAAFEALAYGFAVQLIPAMRKEPHETLIQQTKRLVDQQIQFILERDRQS